MRFLILTDIHANLEALNAVLADSAGEYDSIVCCGDLVGYNADPAAVTDWVAANCAHVIRGNHDKAIAGIDGIEWFNDVAKRSAQWSMEQLSPERLSYLHELPRGPLLTEHFELFHGTPFDEDEYVLSLETAAECFNHTTMPLSFFGHTHLQGGFFQRGRRTGILRAVRAGQRDSAIEIEPDTFYIVNPGSVGQPRDGDPRAAYALYDTGQRLVTLRRVEYPLTQTQEKITAAGLPEALGMRLVTGQ